MALPGLGQDIFLPGGIPVPQLQWCGEGRRSLLASKEPVEVGGLVILGAVPLCESSL